MNDGDTSRWNRPGVPHRGWIWRHVEDMDEPRETCQMCGFYPLRYVHTVYHPGTTMTLHVGCICVENMTRDYATPRNAEKAIKKRVKAQERKRAKFVNPANWKVSAKGNYWRKMGENHIVLMRYQFSYRGDRWGYCVNGVFGKQMYDEFEQAALAVWALVKEELS